VEHLLEFRLALVECQWVG